MVFFCFCAPGRLAAAGDEEELQLTLQEAVERASRVDHRVRAAKLERDKAREEKHKAADRLQDSYVYLTPADEEDHKNVILAELNYQAKSGEEDVARSNLETRVVEGYSNVLVAQEAVESAKQELRVQEWNQKAALAQYLHGMISALEYEQLSSVLKQTQSALAQAEQELAKAYVEFNTLVGLWPERRPVLVTAIPYKPLDVKSITSEASRAVDSSRDLYAMSRYIQIQRLEQSRFLIDAGLQEMGIDVAGLSRFFVDPDLQEMEIDIAELREAEAKSEIQKQVRLFYQEILSLEEAIASVAENVKLAGRALDAASVRYELGLAVEGDVIQAEAKLAAARQALSKMQYAHVSSAAAYRNLTGRKIIPESWSGNGN